MVPFDIVDGIVAQHRGDTVVEQFLDLRQRHVQHQLLTPLYLVLRAQNPIGVGAVEVTIARDHLGLEPEAEMHPQALNMVDQRGQPLGVFARINDPVAQTAGVVVALSEPAVIQHETLCPQSGSTVGDIGQDRPVVVEIHRFPTVVMDGARGLGLGPCHDAVAQMTLKADGTAVQAGV